MKLNVKRTALVGLAFMSISAFWQLYDFSIPLILKSTYNLGDAAGVVMAMDNIVALFLLPLFGALSDKCTLRMGRRMPFMLFGGFIAAFLALNIPAAARFASLPVFLVLLALLLIAMATFRSPTVALMPDVTPKPLRSKANAIINLMGAIGGALVLALTNFLLVKTTNAAGETVSDYTRLYMTVAALLMGAMLVIRLVIPERKLAAETDEINRRLEADSLPVPAADGPVRKLSGPEMTSLVLILCSVSLWFMGYNAVTTAFSKYALKVLEVGEASAANCLLVGTVVAILSYWPVGLLSSRFGRKRMIMGGIVLLMLAFVCAGLLTKLTFVAYILFALVGMGWASIGVNSYPMVVELASGSDVGKYTGYYYTFSMAAQVLTPILSGALLEHVGYGTLFPYAFIMLTLALLTMSRVRHGDSRPEAKKGLGALDVED